MEISDINTKPWQLKSTVSSCPYFRGDKTYRSALDNARAQVAQDDAAERRRQRRRHGATLLSCHFPDSGSIDMYWSYHGQSTAWTTANDKQMTHALMIEYCRLLAKALVLFTSGSSNAVLVPESVVQASEYVNCRMGQPGVWLGHRISAGSETVRRHDPGACLICCSST